MKEKQRLFDSISHNWFDVKAAARILIRYQISIDLLISHNKYAHINVVLESPSNDNLS